MQTKEVIDWSDRAGSDPVSDILSVYSEMGGIDSIDMPAKHFASLSRHPIVLEHLRKINPIHGDEYCDVIDAINSLFLRSPINIYEGEDVIIHTKHGYVRFKMMQEELAMNTRIEGALEPIGYVQRTWLRRLFVIVLGPAILAAMIPFRMIKSTIDFLYEFLKHWIIGGWNGVHR